MRFKSFLLALALPASLSACGQDGSEETVTTEANSMMESENIALGNDGVSVASSGAQDFVNKAAASDRFEIESSKLAEASSMSPAVKEFAAMMIKDHTAMNEKVQKVAQKLSLTPAQSALSRGLEAKANAAITGLKATSGEVYDEGYIASQVSMHGDAQEAARDSLMPSAKSEELKTLLQEAKTKIDAHLQQAQQLQEQL